MHELNYLIDATFRQFFLRDNYSISGRFVKDKRFGNKVAPVAGYWCINLPNGKEFAEEILRNGFIELTPENAKIYGDSFMLEEKKDQEFQREYGKLLTIPQSAAKNINTGISGTQYIEWFTDKNRQDYRGIGFDDGELEAYYGSLMKTPMMQKEEYQASIQSVSSSQKEQIIYKDESSLEEH